MRKGIDLCWNCYVEVSKDLADTPFCRICGFKIGVVAHHIIPVSKGGDHSQDNLIHLCPNHHAMLHNGYTFDDLDVISMGDLVANDFKVFTTRNSDFRTSKWLDGRFDKAMTYEKV